MKRIALAFSLSLVCATAALADSPLPPPWDYDLQNGQYVIHGDVKANKLVVRKVTKGAPIALWEISPWQQPSELSLSPDGQNLVRHIGPQTAAGLDQDVLQFFHQGTQTHRWQLKDFFVSTDALPKSDSRMTWAKDGGWNGNVYSLTLADGRLVKFDGATGELRK
jgi:hypothetical protein